MHVRNTFALSARTPFVFFSHLPAACGLSPGSVSRSAGARFYPQHSLGDFFSLLFNVFLFLFTLNITMICFKYFEDFMSFAYCCKLSEGVSVQFGIFPVTVDLLRFVNRIKYLKIRSFILKNTFFCVIFIVVFVFIKYYYYYDYLS